MEANKCMGGRLGRFQRLLTTVLLPGLWKTPARWHKSWVAVFYFIPALPGCIALWLYPTAITPFPTLEQATVYEGSVLILPHPSRGVGAVALKPATGERITFLCRHGAILDSTCVGGLVLENRQKYEGKHARVLAAQVVKGHTAPEYVAIQIEIDGVVIRSHERLVEQFNSGGPFSNESVIAIARLFAAYILWVLIGFPYLNYRHWMREQ